MDDGFDDLINNLKKIDKLNGQKINISQPMGSVSEELEPALKKRLRDTDEEANNRKAMADAVNGLGVNEKRIDGIVNEFINERILRDII
jgi:hypothetical protein